MAADAVSSVSGANLMAILISVSTFAAISGLICFIFYKKLIAGRLSKQTPKTLLLSPEPATHKPVSGQVTAGRYAGGAGPNKQTLWLSDWVRQTEEANRRRAEESNKRALAEIIAVARREIGRERDRAVSKMRQEYEELVLVSDCHSAGYKE